MAMRHRIKQVEPLQTRLVAEAKRLREEAETLPDGAIRETMLRRAMQGRNWFAHLRMAALSGIAATGVTRPQLTGRRISGSVGATPPQ